MSQQGHHMAMMHTCPSSVDCMHVKWLL